jgi:hypothetical protein
MAIFLLPRDSNHVYNLFMYYVLVLHIMIRMLVLTSAKIEPRVREENNGSTSKLTYTHAHSHADADVIKKVYITKCTIARYSRNFLIFVCELTNPLELSRTKTNTKDSARY